MSVFQPSKIYLASRNQNKVKEINEILISLPYYSVHSLDELAHAEKIMETGNSFKENAYLKASVIHAKYKVNALADDSGLEVEALNYQPGIFSARYAGENASDQENINKLLNLLKNESNRKARFVCVLCLILHGNIYYFEGVVNGTIAEECRGTHGFGYDPIFIPEGYRHTFAEMSMKEKNRISHRGIALHKMADFLARCPLPPAS